MIVREAKPSLSFIDPYLQVYPPELELRSDDTFFGLGVHTSRVVVVDGTEKGKKVCTL